MQMSQTLLQRRRHPLSWKETLLRRRLQMSLMTPLPKPLLPTTAPRYQSVKFPIIEIDQRVILTETVDEVVTGATS